LDTNHLKEVALIISLPTNFLCQVIVENTGLYTFQEAFDRTGRIINITIPPVNSYDPPRLLNYLTAPHICVWSAALASCHIPGPLFTSSL
jgi:TAG lipase/steryl ester hydrolase/phospholipase A2/LPA acyltransferase